MKRKLQDFILNIRNKYINYRLFGKKGAQVCPIWFNLDIRIEDIKKGSIEIHDDWSKWVTICCCQTTAS